MPSRTPSARRRSGPRTDSEQTRAAILRAALEEFAQEGLAGARIDHMARAAGVNKALLYYYFRDKEALYGAALDQVFSELSAKLIPVLEQPLDPRQKMLAYAGAHFDFIAASPVYPRLVQREMMRAGRAGSPHIRRLAERYLRPIQLRLQELFREGIASGAFRAVDANHFIISVVAMNVFYFSSLPMLRLLMGGDPLQPERVAARRAAVLDFVAAALFTAPPEAQTEIGSGSNGS